MRKEVKMGFLKWLFSKKESIEPVETVNPQSHTAEKAAAAPAPYDYGLSGLELFLSTHDYGWSVPDPSHKKVILVNPLDCKEKISLMGLVSAWRGTGHSEWEAILAHMFILSVLNAIESGENEADITLLFNRDFTASKDRVFTKEQVYNHLIGWFDIVEETDEVLKLKIRIE